MKAVGFILLMLVVCQTAIASDRAREQRLMQQFGGMLVEGDVVNLSADGQDFIGIYTEPDRPVGQAVLVLHGRGLHPDFEDVVHPLRTGLAEHGWHTLALQMPVLPTSAGYTEYSDVMSEAAPRLRAAIDYLHAKGINKIHLVAHSCSTQMTMRWVEAGGGDELASLVFIGMGIENYHKRFGSYPPLRKLSQPILDVYGSNDLVASKAAERWKLIESAGNPLSLQVEVPGAEHMFHDYGDQLVELVDGWLSDMAQPQFVMR